MQAVMVGKFSQRMSPTRNSLPPLPLRILVGKNVEYQFVHILATLAQRLIPIDPVLVRSEIGRNRIHTGSDWIMRKVSYCDAQNLKMVKSLAFGQQANPNRKVTLGWVRLGQTGFGAVLPPSQPSSHFWECEVSLPFKNRGLCGICGFFSLKTQNV